MALVRPGALVLAAAIDAPAIYHAAVVHDLPGSTALLRFLIAVPVAAGMLAVLRAMTTPYRQPDTRIHAVAERLDADDEPPPT
jgi:hypothetical protein